MSRYLERKLQAARANADGDGIIAQEAVSERSQLSTPATAPATLPLTTAISATSRIASRPRPQLPPLEQRANSLPATDVNFTNLAQTLRGDSAGVPLHQYTNLPQSQLRGSAGPPDDIQQADIMPSQQSASAGNGLAASSDDLAQLRKVVRKLELHKTQTTGMQQPQRYQQLSQLRGTAPITVHEQHPAPANAAVNDSYVDDDDVELNADMHKHSAQPQPNGSVTTDVAATQHIMASSTIADSDVLPTDISSIAVVHNPQRLQTLREHQYQGQAAGPSVANNTTIYAPADAM